MDFVCVNFSVLKCCDCLIRLVSALKSYADHVKKRATYYNKISRVETRNDVEKEHAEVHQAQLSTRCVTPLTLACKTNLIVSFDFFDTSGLTYCGPDIGIYNYTLERLAIDCAKFSTEITLQKIFS